MSAKDIVRIAVKGGDFIDEIQNTLIKKVLPQKKSTFVAWLQILLRI